MSDHLVVLRASPEVRGVCPPEWIEGLWMLISKHTVMTIDTPPGARRMVIEPTGRWEHNDSGESAPVWEARYA